VEALEVQMNPEKPKAELRKTGISVVGDLPWGTHFCHFYETKEDLLDILVPYFRAGLESHEFCVWVVFDPINEDDARNALRAAVPETDQHLARGDIEILLHSEWYLKNGVLDVQRVTRGWQEKLDQALAKGYEGLRVNGNEAWLTEREWQDFLDYERELNGIVFGRRMIVCCTYPLAKSKAAEIFDVARSHEFSVARRSGRWEVLETPELNQAKAEIKRLNEQLERRVEERTADLASANQTLRNEIAERKLVANKLKDSGERLRALSARLESLREEERTRISREVHDELGQKLTGIKMDLHWLESRLEKIGDEKLRTQLEERIVAANATADEMIATVQRIATELRPDILDNLGLVSAVRHEAKEFESRTGILATVSLPDDSLHFPREISTTAYRIFQEMLTNVARHAQATEVRVSLQSSGGRLHLVVEDNGRGLSPDIPTRPNSLGLLGMKERAAMVGGNLTVEGSPGRGTTVRLEIPNDSGRKAS
jgi:signal transduction histidine kinase